MGWAQICGSSSLSPIHLQISNIFFVKYSPFFMSSPWMPSIPTPFLNFAIAHSASDSKISGSFIALGGESSSCLTLIFLYLVPPPLRERYWSIREGTESSNEFGTKAEEVQLSRHTKDDRHYVLEGTKSQRRHDRGVQNTYRKGADRFRTVFHASTATLQPERTWEKVSQREIKIRHKETFLQPESDQWMEQSPSRSCELWIS